MDSVMLMATIEVKEHQDVATFNVPNALILLLSKRKANKETGLQ